MPRKIPRLLWLGLPLAYVLYFYHLGSTGVLGPDEPRYASVGHEMALSGDWITPRLWGLPWFEKPALLYWMIGTGFRLGLGPDLAPRVPVAVLAVLFLGFYWWILKREFGCMTAGLATLILGSSVAWQAVGQAGVADLPLSATFAAGMLLAVPWVSRGETRHLPLVSALLGFAVLAKGPLALVLALPLLFRANLGRNLKDLLRLKVVLPFVAIALPWYVLCYLRNGAPFINEFFIRHNIQRFTSAEVIQHGQHWWYYLPIVVAGLLPWAPLLAVAFPRSTWHDPRRRFLAAWMLWGLLFLSISANKLPAYVLPLMPAAAVLMALGLSELPQARVWLAVCALLLVAFVIAAPLVAGALSVGLSKAARPQFQWLWLSPLPIAALVWVLDGKGLRIAAAASVAVGVALGAIYVKNTAANQLAAMPSPRALWQQVAPHQAEVCVDQVHRNWRYGLNYYAGAELPECSGHPMPWQVRQTQGQPPHLDEPRSSLATRTMRVDPTAQDIVRSITGTIETEK